MTPLSPWTDLWEEEVQAGTLWSARGHGGSLPGRRRQGRGGQGPSPQEDGATQVCQEQRGPCSLVRMPGLVSLHL